MPDELYDEFNKTLYRTGAPVYKGDGTPITNISDIQPSHIGDGFSTGGTEMVNNFLQSGNFEAGIRGWQLTPSSASFYTGIFNIGGTTITIDNTQDIQTNLDLISSEGGGTLYLQNGTYTLTADVTIPSGVVLQGVSRDGVIIDCNTSYAVKIVGTDVYSTGTVTINNGDTTVVGSGTTWTSAMVGRSILLDGLWYEITAFTDTTHITIDTYQGDNLAGSTYVLATINSTTQLNKVTVTGATGSGIVVQYAMEPTIYDCVIYGCGTGIEMDYVVFPVLQVTSNENGVNLNMNFVEGFSINFSEFNFSTTGAGIIMTDTRNATLFNTSVNDNTGDGINATSCDKIAYISFDISGNGGQGVEFVSGCDDNQFTDGVVDGNTSDGIKLTATNDRNVFVAMSVKNNGGYGINIAAATCDNNQIIAPAFDTNSSGNINDSGTNTFISPQTPYFYQRVPVSGLTTAGTVYAVASTSDGSVLAVFQNTGSELFRFEKDVKIGAYRQTHRINTTPTGEFSSAVIVGSYLYIFYDPGNEVVGYRYDLADFANETLLTMPSIDTAGANYNITTWTDGTFIYLAQTKASTTGYKLSISGTTLSTVTTSATAVSFGGNYSCIFDGINIYQTEVADGTITIKKASDAFFSASSTTTIIFTPESAFTGAANSITANINSNTIYIGCFVNGYDQTGQIKVIMSIAPFTKP